MSRRYEGDMTSLYRGANLVVPQMQQNRRGVVSP